MHLSKKLYKFLRLYFLCKKGGNMEVAIIKRKLLDLGYSE